MTANSYFNEISSFPMRLNSMKIEISKKREYLDFIKSNFKILSQREIARRLKLGKTTINRWASEVGLKFKKHTVNETFFDDLNETSAYILGYIFADGNVAWNPEKGYYSLTITACEKDKSHLEKIRSILSSTKSLLYSPTTKSYRLIVNNKNLCRRLIQLGVIPAKSLFVEFPKISNQHVRHFIRGVIDGDGNVRYVQRKRSPYFEITIASGSKLFCGDLIASIKENTGIDANTRKVGKNTFVIQYSCSRGEKLADFIYSKANIFLERKYLPYKNNVGGR